MTGKLSTHILDTARGCPAAGVCVDLYRLDPDGSRHHILTTLTNEDGRTDSPLLDCSTIAAGEWELVFHMGDYFASAGTMLTTVPVRFRITDPTRPWHIPLLCSPWSYSTYRGS